MQDCKNMEGVKPSVFCFKGLAFFGGLSAYFLDIFARMWKIAFLCGIFNSRLGGILSWIPAGRDTL